MIICRTVGEGMRRLSIYGTPTSRRRPYDDNVVFAAGSSNTMLMSQR